MNRSLHALLLLLALIVSGCSTLWPEYEKPRVDVPPPLAKPLSIDRQWWKAFRDPVLDRLIEEALANNWDLAKAAANVEEARANLGVARSQLSPRLDGLAQINSKQRQLSIGQKNIDDVTTSAAVGVNAYWEIDLWDRIKQTNDAALARYASSEHTRNATALSISALVAESWFRLRLFEVMLGITRDAAANLKTASELEFRRWQAGAGTELTYTQSVAEFSSTESRLPMYEKAIAATDLALQLLVGRSPRAMAEPLPRSAGLHLPDTPKEVDSMLLLRRPDVASAEQLLVAAHADVNSARAEFYPRFTLSLLAGFIASTSSAISGMPLFWDALAGLSGPIFDGGLVQSKAEAAEARRQRALAHYQYTVSLAFRETYEALVLLDTSDRRVKLVENEVSMRKKVKQLSEKSYEAGRTSKFEVLAETTKVLNAELEWSQARLDQYVARSQYYKALGGGF